jgi:ABC-type uncharacterized transport system ATPase subunit
LRKLAASGCSILYISHKLDEIRHLCSACTVLRGGKLTGICDPRQESAASLSRLMIGAEPARIQHRPAQTGPEVLTIKGMSLAQEDPFGVSLKDLNLQVRAGEVVGIAGVSGNGQKELMAALSGEDTRTAPGCLFMGQQDLAALNPQDRRALGLHFVPEERLGRGAVPDMTLAHNLLLTRADSQTVKSSGWLNLNQVQQKTQAIIERFRVKAPGPHALARSLSGGNLQKYIVGREIDAQPQLLIVSQPTWGVDVGAAAQIRNEILALRDQGCAVLVVSEELEELFEISDRLVVLAKGRLSPSVPTVQTTVEQIGLWMSGLWSEPQPQGVLA